MSIETNRKLILEFYQAFDQRNIDRAFALLASNFVAHLAGIPETLDLDGFKEFGMMFYSAFTDGQHQFEQIIAAEDKVITCGTFTAIHTGTFQGLPTTGKQITISVMHIDRIEQGKIIEHWGQGDAQGLMQQLGVMFFTSPKLMWKIFKDTIKK
ncbi:MAG: ester cyclase [Cyanobacteria bacterium P01_A01_bin.40]